MRSRRIGAVDLRPEVEHAYNADVQEALADTVWNAGGCQSYYLDRNGRNSSIYPWSIVDLQRRTRRFDAERYEMRSEVTSAASASST